MTKVSCKSGEGVIKGDVFTKFPALAGSRVSILTNYRLKNTCSNFLVNYSKYRNRILNFHSRIQEKSKMRKKKPKRSQGRKGGKNIRRGDKKNA